MISTFQPFPWAIKVSDSKDIRFRNIHCYSNSKVSFDSAVYDQTHDARGPAARVRLARPFPAARPPARPKRPPPVLAAGAKVEKLAGGFYNISGGAVDPAGDFYFVDAHWQRIYRWSAADPPAFDGARQSARPRQPGVRQGRQPDGGVLRRARARCTRSSPARRMATSTVLTAAARRAAARHDRRAAGGRLAREPAGARANPTAQYVSPDGSTFLPAGQDFVSGAMSWGVKSERAAARLRPGRGGAGQAGLHHQRGRNHHLEGDGRARWRPGRI